MPAAAPITAEALPPGSVPVAVIADEQVTADYNGQQIPVATAVPITATPVREPAMAYATAVRTQPSAARIRAVHPLPDHEGDIVVAHERVETNALLAWIGCCCCPAIGLFSVYMSVKADNYARMGRMHESRKAARIAKQLALVAIIVGLSWMFWRSWNANNTEQELAAQQQQAAQQGAAKGTPSLPLNATDGLGLRLL